MGGTDFSFSSLELSRAPSRRRGFGHRLFIGLASAGLASGELFIYLL